MMTAYVRKAGWRVWVPQSALPAQAGNTKTRRASEVRHASRVRPTQTQAGQQTRGTLAGITVSVRLASGTDRGQPVNPVKVRSTCKHL